MKRRESLTRDSDVVCEARRIALNRDVKLAQEAFPFQRNIALIPNHYHTAN